MRQDESAKSLQVTTGSLPASRKIHIAGTIHPDLRVAMREIELAPEAGEPPVRVYDPSGPYTDSAAKTDIRAGLPKLREAWIEARGDTETYPGREVRPEDNGLKPEERLRAPLFDRTGLVPRRARPGKAPTQLA